MIKIAGFVLTGGRSSRMGKDKALLPVGDQTLCEHIGDVVGVFAQQVLLVGHPERYRHLKYPAIADVHPGRGPLSGLETVLNLEMAEFCIVTGCDAYNLDPDWLRLLLAEAERSDALCTVARDASGNMQPLCGVYRKECRVIVSKAISEGRLRATELLAELNAIPVMIQGMLLNLNTSEEYDQLANA